MGRRKLASPDVYRVKLILKFNSSRNNLDKGEKTQENNLPKFYEDPTVNFLIKNNY